MIQKLNDIKSQKHPSSEKISKTISLLNNIFIYANIALDFMGFIVAITASTAWAEQYDQNHDITVNFFGYFIEIENEATPALPFFVFLYIIIIFSLITLAIYCIKTITIAILKSKINMLDCLYRTELLTALSITNSCSYQSVITSCSYQPVITDLEETTEKMDDNG